MSTFPSPLPSNCCNAEILISHHPGEEIRCVCGKCRKVVPDFYWKQAERISDGWKKVVKKRETMKEIIKSIAKFMNMENRVIELMILQDDWSLWRQVELKVMEDHDLFLKLVIEVAHHEDNWALYMAIDLKTRCEALCSILPKK